MRLYVDTADVDRVRECLELGVVDGVTTNPTIIVDAGVRYRAAVQDLAAAVDGPVYAQVLADQPAEMVRQAKAYDSWAEDVVVKLPATAAGYRALARLTDTPVAAGITVVFSVEQAVLAAKGGASFVAPYVGRLNDAGQDGLETLRRIRAALDGAGLETELLAASIRNTRQATAAYEIGVDAVTMAPSVLEAHIDHPETTASVAGFQDVWGDRGSPVE